MLKAFGGVKVVAFGIQLLSPGSLLEVPLDVFFLQNFLENPWSKDETHSDLCIPWWLQTFFIFTQNPGNI